MNGVNNYWWNRNQHWKVVSTCDFNIEKIRWDSGWKFDRQYIVCIGFEKLEKLEGSKDIDKRVIQ